MCLRTLPWGTHTHLSQDGSQSEGFWEEQDSLWPGIILWLLTPRSLSAAHVCSPLSFTQTGFCLLCPCQDYSLEVFTRDKDWLFTCFCCYSTSKRKWGWLYISQLEPTYVASGNEKKRPADCEFPTWSPSISYLTGSFNSGNENEIRIIPNTTHKNKLQIR